MIKQMLIHTARRTSLFIERHATTIGWVFVAVLVLCMIGLALIQKYGDPWTVTTFQYGYPVDTQPRMTYFLAVMSLAAGFISWGMLSPSVGRSAVE